MSTISLLIKPASSGCNLKCKYCFYNDIAENRQVKSYGHMKEYTLEQIVKKALEFADTQCLFAFQGGEPTLVGLDFYKKLIEFERRYNKKNVRIVNTIQTNGIAIDDKFGKFLYENNFLVGLSIDGYKDVHDKNRVDYENKGTFTRVMKAVEVFNRYGVEYNVLYVVTSESARHANKIYSFFKKNNFRYIQFIPCLDPLEGKGDLGYSLKPEVYGQFLKTTFDLWYKDIFNNEAVSIRYFDNLLRRIMGYNTESCGMNGICSCQFVIEANGGVYPCDFYVTDQWYMGNILEDDMETLVRSSKVLEFIKSSNYIYGDCRKCQWLNLCRGGCRREREPFFDGKPGLNKHCKAYDEFFNYSVKRFYDVARYITSRRE